jgi:fibronectin type 3 domain-containing protein
VLNSAPKAPSNLNIGAYNSSSVSLLWTDNSTNATGYELWRSNNTGAYTGVYKVLMGSNVNSYIDLNISSIANYSYKVRAFNEGGKSAFSNEVSMNNVSGNSWNLQAQSWGSNDVHLTWVDFVANESGFEIQRLDPGATDYVSLTPLVAPNSTSFDDNDRSAGATYSYRIRYFIAPSTLSSFSNVATITTLGWTINPPSITGSGSDSSGVYITWSDASNTQAIGTIIERSDNRTPRNYLQVGNVSIIKGNWYIKKDNPAGVSGNNYYYRVRQIISLTNNQFTAPSNEYSVQWP